MSIPSGSKSFSRAKSRIHTRFQPISADIERSRKPSKEARFRALNAVARVRIPSGLPCDVARHGKQFEPSRWGLAVFACAAPLVVDGWVEDQLADELAGGGVDDVDVEAVDQHEDGGVRPTPMWCSRPLWRRVSVPPVSMMSLRIRACGWLSEPPGAALGRAGIVISRVVRSAKSIPSSPPARPVDERQDSDPSLLQRRILRIRQGNSGMTCGGIDNQRRL